MKALLHDAGPRWQRWLFIGLAHEVADIITQLDQRGVIADLVGPRAHDHVQVEAYVEIRA